MAVEMSRQSGRAFFATWDSVCFAWPAPVKLASTEVRGLKASSACVEAIGADWALLGLGSDDTVAAGVFGSVKCGVDCANQVRQAGIAKRNNCPDAQAHSDGWADFGGCVRDVHLAYYFADLFGNGAGAV